MSATNVTKNLRDHWASAWHELGSPAPAILGDLVARYDEPHRHYHTKRHLEHCLMEFDRAAELDLAQSPGEIAVALFFHDAIYDARNMTPHANEAASARWARKVLAAVGVDEQVADRVDALIMATCHDAEPPAGDPALLVDIDLAILGQPAERFDEYEEEVRAEYAWVPAEAFKAGRGKILRQFLGRERLYKTAYFFERYEGQARENLARSLARLGES